MNDSETRAKDEAKVFFIKTHNYVEIPIHGAFGGINAKTGQLYMAVYSERSPIPQELFYDVGPDGTAREMVERRVGKEGPVRIVQAVLHFDINTAVALRDWLNDKVDVFAKEHPELSDKLGAKR